MKLAQPRWRSSQYSTSGSGGKGGSIIEGLSLVETTRRHRRRSLTAPPRQVSLALQDTNSQGVRNQASFARVRARKSGLELSAH
jgi:hypothetical protein